MGRKSIATEFMAAMNIEQVAEIAKRLISNGADKLEVNAQAQKRRTEITRGATNMKCETLPKVTLPSSEIDRGIKVSQLVCEFSGNSASNRITITREGKVIL